jgi:hypothetical protein
LHALNDIDSIAKGHWIIEFRRPIFDRVQRNPEDGERESHPAFPAKKDETTDTSTYAFRE